MKEQYIKQLEKELHLSRKEKKEVIRDLTEIFSSAIEHGECEQQVIDRLGTPKEYADSIAEQLGVNNRKRRKIIGGIAVITVAALLIAVLSIWSPVIFQRGNPIPYLIAAAKITDETPYVLVTDHGDTSVYIAKKGSCPQLFEYIEESCHVAFTEQAGSGYIFSNGIDSLVVSSEIYWSRYTVWQVPTRTLAAPDEELSIPN